VTRILSRLYVHALSTGSSTGILKAGGLQFPCSLGRMGRKYRKREGDGATPHGAYSLCRLFYRADRMPPPTTALQPRPIRDHDGWCETVGDRNYNRLVRIPYATSHEFMKREDRLYDVVVELSQNKRPRVQGLGSAVFLHLRRPDGGPTAGCVAVSMKDMKVILSRCGPKTRIVL
jgi:L,D-peptidoglycan transpeptidase YkuD (ErfK/YbiS/YcfS/YnhG family)